jgi:hypothetical protein
LASSTHTKDPVKLLVVSHKPCWRSAASPSGFATDGGFPFQMRALSELFDRTTLLVPCAPSGPADGELPLTGTQLSVVPLTMPAGTGWLRKMAIAPWLLRNLPALWRAVGAADAVHAPIPGDVGTFGMLLAIARGKPLFVRHCGNWLEPRTAAEHAWKWAMQRLAGGRNVMLATGGTADPPSTINPAVRWIFSTTLNAEELAASAVERQGPAAGRLLIACRQDREKGADLVLESLALVRRHDDPGIDRARPGARRRAARAVPRQA